LSIIPLYIDDTSEKNKWPIASAQLWFLHHRLESLSVDLKAKGAKLILRRGDPKKILSNMAEECDAQHIFYNRCYEPYAIKRDTEIKKSLLIAKSFNGSLLVEPWEMQTKQGGFFKVYTPFYKSFRQNISVAAPLAAPRQFSSHSGKLKTDSLASWNLLPTKPNWASDFAKYWQPGEKGASKQLKEFIKNGLSIYNKQRDFPAIEATSHLSPYLHLGNISPRQIWQAVYPKGEKFLSEVVWREFAYHLLYHSPQLPEENYNAKFNRFPWSKNKSHLEKWQQGKTGYPIVDAGMRELWHTGIMHNRVRMIVGSFLTKHLLLHWREGQAWFWDTLVDADLASNAFGWQWIAGSGADAAPYFRIFNPILQGQKFDPDGEYIFRWLPELKQLPKKLIHTPWLYEDQLDYPPPIVDHQAARQRALAAYQKIK